MITQIPILSSFTCGVGLMRGDDLFTRVSAGLISDSMVGVRNGSVLTHISTPYCDDPKLEGVRCIAVLEKVSSR